MSLKQLEERMVSYEAKSLHGFQSCPEASVLVAVTDNEKKPEIIFTLRSKHLTTHGGEVAFPGGKRDDSDENLLETALRESFEEIHLPSHQVKVLGSLDQTLSRFEILVTPFVGIVPADVELKPQLSELDVIFKVPIEYFLTCSPQRMDKISIRHYQCLSPSFSFQTYEIWGLTARIVADLLNVAFDAGINLKVNRGISASNTSETEVF